MRACYGSGADGTNLVVEGVIADCGALRGPVPRYLGNSKTNRIWLLNLESEARGDFCETRACLLLPI